MGASLWQEFANYVAPASVASWRECHRARHTPVVDGASHASIIDGEVTLHDFTDRQALATTEALEDEWLTPARQRGEVVSSCIGASLSGAGRG